MTRLGSYRKAWLLACLPVLTAASGCVSMSITGCDPDQVTIRFVNNSVYAVEPLLYATADAVVDLQFDLLVDSKRIAGFGLAGKGILSPGRRDTIRLDCSAVRFLGTPGTRFLDADDDEVKGTGDQILLSQGEQARQFRCGATITFTYTGPVLGIGDYEVDFDIDNPR